MKTNAKEEFLVHVHGRDVLCAKVSSRGNSLLHQGYTEDEYQRFLCALDFIYDSGYGGQELYGTIWYADGTWSDRGEYDGSEWWEHQECPAIPECLKEPA